MWIFLVPYSRFQLTFHCNIPNFVTKFVAKPTGSGKSIIFQMAPLAESHLAKHSQDNMWKTGLPDLMNFTKLQKCVLVKKCVDRNVCSSYRNYFKRVKNTRNNEISVRIAIFKAS